MIPTVKHTHREIIMKKQVTCLVVAAATAVIMTGCKPEEAKPGGEHPAKPAVEHPEKPTVEKPEKPAKPLDHPAH